MSYTVNGKKYETWSGKNQHILNHLVDENVYCCMTSEVEYMISRIPFYDDDNPFTEDDYSKMMVPYCSKCQTSYDLEETTVRQLDDSDFEKDTNYDDEDGYLCPICADWHPTIQEARECCDIDATVYKCNNCGEIIAEDDLDTRPEEIFEWWAVSCWFGEKLAEQGCVVIESYGKSYWGRTTTGQSISLDGCIASIAKKLQILEGMENEWRD